jgi:hypothetical protein
VMRNNQRYTSERERRCFAFFFCGSWEKCGCECAHEGCWSCWRCFVRIGANLFTPNQPSHKKFRKCFLQIWGLNDEYWEIQNDVAKRSDVLVPRMIVGIIFEVRGAQTISHREWNLQ